MPVNLSDGVGLLAGGDMAGNVLLAPVFVTPFDSGEAVCLRAACLVAAGPLQGL